MNTFSARSMAHYQKLHPDLQKVADKVLEHRDCAITDSYRGDVEQQAAFDKGLSRAKPGQSKHNRLPSEAMHLVPFPVPVPPDPNLTHQIDSAERARQAAAEWREYAFFAGRVLQAADDLGIRIRWGGDWNENDTTVDNHFNDLQHYELMP